MEPEAPNPIDPQAQHVPDWEANPARGFTLSRRTLLIGGGALLAGGLLTGLNLQAQQAGYRGLLPTGSALSPDNFLHFSALVTGFAGDELDAPTAQALYTALQENPPAAGASLADLLRKAGYMSSSPPRTLDDIERRGVFDEEPYATTANSVIDAWYSGLITQADGAATTIAWLPALGWKALGYTQAPGYCAGETGVWGEPPATAAAPAL